MFSNLFKKVATTFSVSAETQNKISFGNAFSHAIKATVLTLDVIGHTATSCSKFLQFDVEATKADKELTKAIGAAMKVVYHAGLAAVTLGAVLLDGAVSLGEKAAPIIYNTSIAGANMLSNQFFGEKEEGDYIEGVSILLSNDDSTPEITETKCLGLAQEFSELFQIDDLD